MLKLYDYFRSSASFRVRIALNLKNLPFECIPVHLINNGGEQHHEDYAAINPQQLIPSLNAKGKILTQSLAIIEYLEDCYPDPPLLPKDFYARAQVRAFALAIVADIHPLNNLRVLNYLTQHFTASDEQKNTWYKHWIQITFNALEEKVKSFSTTYAFGKTPSLADLCLVPQMYNARRFEVDLSSFPTLVNIDAACRKHLAFQKAWPNDP